MMSSISDEEEFFVPLGLISSIKRRHLVHENNEEEISADFTAFALNLISSKTVFLIIFVYTK